jgi:hypothetical protein
MARRQTKAAEAGPALTTLPPKRPDDTQTAWEDPWAAISKEVWEAQEQAGGMNLAPDAHAVGRRITEEINADPAEVKRLRSARKNARAGKTFPRHSDTR